MADSTAGPEKLTAMKEKLQQLKRRREEGREKNFQEVVKEDAKSKENPADEAKREREKKDAEKLLAMKEAEANGVDYMRERFMTFTAEQTEKWEEAQEKKRQRADVGFVDYKHATVRQYNRMVDELKVDKEHYEETKAKMSDQEFYRDANSLLYANDAKPRRQDVDRLVESLKKQQTRREKSRRNKEKYVDTVDFINDKNKQFNAKVAKAFDKYTNEIKQNLERGTAL